MQKEVNFWPSGQQIIQGLTQSYNDQTWANSSITKPILACLQLTLCRVTPAKGQCVLIALVCSKEIRQVTQTIPKRKLPKKFLEMDKNCSISITVLYRFYFSTYHCNRITESIKPNIDIMLVVIQKGLTFLKNTLNKNVHKQR